MANGPTRPTKEDPQGLLLDVAPDWRADWWGMPSFEMRDARPDSRLTLNFLTPEDRAAFAERLGVRVSGRADSMWYPPQAPLSGQFRYEGPKTDSRYPVCIPSKGRADVQKTGGTLDVLGVSYRFFVEETEADDYRRALGEERVVEMPFHDLGQGSVPARNFIWEWAKERGAKRHWTVDDNIVGFARCTNNRRLRVYGGGFFRAMEDFVDRYENVAMAGPHHLGFVPDRGPDLTPFLLNSRVYSCILLDTSLYDDFPWRGRYNEDTDLSLRLLKAGYVTILFRALMMDKGATYVGDGAGGSTSTRRAMKGGNTDTVYAVNDHRLAFAESLREQHPDVVEVVWKFGRWHHQVNYAPFRRNALKLRPGVISTKKVDDYGMILHRRDVASSIEVNEPTAAKSRESLSSDWCPPDVTRLPERLSGWIGFDVETKDEGLAEGKGPGWPWGGGYVVGYAVAADGFETYLPVRHEGGGNLDGYRVRRWLNQVLSDPDQPKVGANVWLYDVPWAESDGVQIAGPVWDCQWAEALLDEHRLSYSLDSIARDRLGRGKEEELLLEACRTFGYSDPKGDLWRLHSRFVGPYATQDPVLARDLLRVQLPEIETQGLRRVFDLEHALGPLYVDVRRRGVRIDISRAEALLEKCQARRDELVAEIRRRTGVAVNLSAAESLVPAFDAAGVAYGTTPKTGKPSITKEILGASTHWLPKLVLEARQYDKRASTFLEGGLLGHLHGDRVHPEMHPLRVDRDEDGKIRGAVTGRISMSNPNPTFFPVRTEEGKEVRRCFLPEEGELWASPDISQQEPRLATHFAALANLPGALEVRDRYRADPNLSFHELVVEIVRDFGVENFSYVKGKTLNLARIYGRGVWNTAQELGLSVDEVKELFRRHAEALPFLAALAELAQRRVEEVGYVRSLLGRRMRFPFWELKGRWDDDEKRFVKRPAGSDEEDPRMLRWDEAVAAWPGERLQRARLHKALNSVIQPSAADQTKTALLELWSSGLGRHVLFQVYDEVPASVPSPEVGDRIAECVRDAVKLEVPVRVDVSTGANWGEAK